MSKITRFDEDFAFLSNFYPCSIEMDGMTFPTLENAYQAAKTPILEDRVKFVSCSPGKAKRLGREGYLLKDWLGKRLVVMEMLLRKKFSQQPLKSQLLATGDAYLAEGNHWGDQYWGTVGGVGMNHLGRLLMQIREELKA